MTRDAGEEFLRSQLERSFRELVFLSRVSLKDLALIFPHAERCAGRREFLGPYIDSLRALILLGNRCVPDDVARLAKQYSEVARFLPELGPGGAGGRREVAGCL